MAYCIKQNYSFLAVNEPYSPFNNFKDIKLYLQKFDRVLTCGSDTIFTDFDKPIDMFCKNYINLCIERWATMQGSFFNGDTLLFDKKDDRIFDIIDKIDTLQEDYKVRYANESNQQFDTFIYCGTTYLIHKNMEYGTQSTFNKILINHETDILDKINVIDVGQLQSYSEKFIHYCCSPMIDEAKWKKGKFLLHLIGCQKATKLEAITDFFNNYPEYNPDTMLV